MKRQLRELQKLIAWSWDARVDEHPPGEKAMQDFENVLNFQLDGSRRRRTTTTPASKGGTDASLAAGAGSSSVKPPRKASVERDSKRASPTPGLSALKTGRKGSKMPRLDPSPSPSGSAAEPQRPPSEQQQQQQANSVQGIEQPVAAAAVATAVGAPAPAPTPAPAPAAAAMVAMEAAPTSSAAAVAAGPVASHAACGPQQMDCEAGATKQQQEPEQQQQPTAAAGSSAADAGAATLAAAEATPAVARQRQGSASFPDLPTCSAITPAAVLGGVAQTPATAAGPYSAASSAPPSTAHMVAALADAHFLPTPAPTPLPLAAAPRFLSNVVLLPDSGSEEVPPPAAAAPATVTSLPASAPVSGAEFRQPAPRCVLTSKKRRLAAEPQQPAVPAAAGADEPTAGAEELMPGAEVPMVEAEEPIAGAVEPMEADPVPEAAAAEPAAVPRTSPVAVAAAATVAVPPPKASEQAGAPSAPHPASAGPASPEPAALDLLSSGGAAALAAVAAEVDAPAVAPHQAASTPAYTPVAAVVVAAEPAAPTPAAAAPPASAAAAASAAELPADVALFPQLQPPAVASLALATPPFTIAAPTSVCPVVPPATELPLGCRSAPPAPGAVQVVAAVAVAQVPTPVVEAFAAADQLVYLQPRPATCPPLFKKASVRSRPAVKSPLGKHKEAGHVPGKENSDLNGVAGIGSSTAPCIGEPVLPRAAAPAVTLSGTKQQQLQQLSASFHSRQRRLLELLSACNRLQLQQLQEQRHAAAPAMATSAAAAAAGKASRGSVVQAAAAAKPPLGPRAAAVVAAGSWAAASAPAEGRQARGMSRALGRLRAQQAI